MLFALGLWLRYSIDAPQALPLVQKTCNQSIARQCTYDKKRCNMIHSKILRSLALCLMLLLGISSAQAHGPRGYVGVHYGWGGYYDPWLAPVMVGSAIVGTSFYMSRPYGVVQPSTVYINTPPPAVIVTNTPPPVQWVGAPNTPVSEAYYCRETGQYFPVAQTCVSPWLVVYQR